MKQMERLRSRLKQRIDPGDSQQGTKSRLTSGGNCGGSGWIPCPQISYLLCQPLLRGVKREELGPSYFLPGFRTRHNFLSL